MYIQKPYHKVKKFINKGYKVIGIVYWNDGKFDAVMSKEVTNWAMKKTPSQLTARVLTENQKDVLLALISTIANNQKTKMQKYGYYLGQERGAKRVH